MGWRALGGLAWGRCLIDEPTPSTMMTMNHPHTYTGIINLIDSSIPRGEKATLMAAASSSSSKVPRVVTKILAGGASATASAEGVRARSRWLGWVDRPVWLECVCGGGVWDLVGMDGPLPVPT